MSRTILGKPGPALAAEGEKQVFSSPNSVLISPCDHPNDLWTLPNVSSEEKASRLPPIRSLFFHHFDWNRWFASLATTVDNTIKMADRSFKHGRQWCIRRIRAQWLGVWEFLEGRQTVVFHGFSCLSPISSPARCFDLEDHYKHCVGPIKILVHATFTQ